MGACFNLTKKGESSPTSLNRIDEEICDLLGIEVHPRRWAYAWYDYIGWELAFGHSFETIRKKIQKDSDGVTDKEDLDFYAQMLKIANFLEENYVAKSWSD